MEFIILYSFTNLFLHKLLNMAENLLSNLEMSNRFYDHYKYINYLTTLLKIHNDLGYIHHLGDKLQT